MKAILSRIRDFIYPWHNKPENQSRTEARSHLCMTGVFFVLSFFMEKVRGVSLFTLPLFENDAYQGLLDIAIDTLLTTGLYLFMYYFVRFVYDRVYWIPKNKDKMLQGIQEDSQWLVRMVENLLSITRIDSGKVKIVKSPVVLEELIDSVILKFRKRYPSQLLELDIPDEIALIPMDAILIEQVIINILENAVQHAAGMTRLSLRVYLLANQAIFEIQDDGCGIPEADQPHVFDPFFRGDNSLKSEGKGLGLAVVKTVADTLGWSIRVNSAPGKGSCFTLEIPVD